MGLCLGRSLNIAQLHASLEDDQAVHLVSTLCTGGDLWSRIRRGTYGEAQAARLVGDVLRAVVRDRCPAARQPVWQPPLWQRTHKQQHPCLHISFEWDHHGLLQLQPGSAPLQ
jgi:hypothetical protein